jgi:hypothetical protein
MIYDCGINDTEPEMGMSGMTRGPKGYARNDTEPETGMSGMTRSPKWVCPE